MSETAKTFMQYRIKALGLMVDSAEHIGKLTKQAIDTMKEVAITTVEIFVSTDEQARYELIDVVDEAVTEVTDRLREMIDTETQSFTGELINFSTEWMEALKLKTGDIQGVISAVEAKYRATVYNAIEQEFPWIIKGVKNIYVENAFEPSEKQIVSELTRLFEEYE